MRRPSPAATALALALAGCSAFADLSGLSGGDAPDGVPTGPNADAGPSPTDGGPPRTSPDGAPAPTETCDADLQTDARHCGRCGRDCAGGTCQAGMCSAVTIASNLQEAWYLDIHADTGVYVGENRDNGRLFRIPGGGAPPEELGNVGGVFGLLAGADGVTFVSGYRSNLVRRIRSGTKTIEPVADVAMHGLEIARSDGVLWVTGRLPDTATPPRGRFLQISGGSAPVTRLAQYEINEGLHVDATSLYVTSNFSHELLVLPRAGGPPTRTIPTTTIQPRRLAGDAEAVYVASYGDPKIVRVAKSTGAVSPIAVDDANVEHGCIVVDDAHVYWASSVTGTVKRVPKNGGRVEIMARDIPRPVGLAQDATSIYFSAHGTVGTSNAYVARVTK